ncbi:MAG: D-amino-acid transaminase [Caulobacterales bacterium]
MSRIAYVNGSYRPLSEPLIDVEDRGYQFGDGIYEVWGVYRGALMDAEGHVARLQRSLRELRIAMPMTTAALMIILKEVQRRNRVSEGYLYLQITRGVAPRDHAFPSPQRRPIVVVTAKQVDPAFAEEKARNGVSIITTPEIRWARRDIKTINLLPNVLAKQAAREAGAVEAWFVTDEGLVTEGSSSNAWIVDENGVLRTAPLSNAILHGVTRAALTTLAEQHQIRIEERSFTKEDALTAREAFLTSASNVAIPIVRIDGREIGGGTPGPVAKLLRDAYYGAA